MKYFLLFLSLICSGCALSKPEKVSCVHLDLGEVTKATGKPLITLGLPQKEGEDIMVNVNGSLLFWIAQQSMMQQPVPEK